MAFTDNFNRAAPLGSNWSTWSSFSAMTISSNTAVAPGTTTYGISNWTGAGAPTTGAHFIQATVSTTVASSSELGLNVRGVASTSNGFILDIVIAASSAAVLEVTSGTPTTRATGGTLPSSGHVVRAVSTSGAVTLYNDTTVATVISYSSTAKNTNTQVGIFGYNNGNTPAWDNASGGDGTAPSTSATATPSAVSVSASIPAVSPTVSKNATVTPAAVSCTVAVAGGTVSASTTVAATAVAVTSTVGAPAMIGGATIAAATVAGTVSLPPPTLSAGSTIAATALAVTATVDSVAPTTTTPVDATATPSPISSTASIARGA